MLIPLGRTLAERLPGCAKLKEILTLRNSADIVNISPMAAIMTTTIGETIVNAFAQIPEVEGIYLRQSGSMLRVFTVVDEENDSAFEKIYQKERSLAHSSPDFQFDFNVIARRGRDVQEFVGANVPLWQRQPSDQPCHTAAHI